MAGQLGRSQELPSSPARLAALREAALAKGRARLISHSENFIHEEEQPSPRGRAATTAGAELTDSDEDERLRSATEPTSAPGLSARLLLSGGLGRDSDG